MINTLMIYQSGQADLKQRMLDDARLIIQTVDFLERQIEEKLREISIAQEQFNFSSVEVLEGQVLGLLNKLNKEESNMDEHTARYKELVAHEKATLLSIIDAEKKVSLWGLPTYQRGAATGSLVPS